VGKKTLGEQELDLLRWVAESGPVTVGRAAEIYGSERGLARSTVLTMMERLRTKGRLQRRRVAGVYEYASPVPAAELMRGVVSGFVEKALAGSVSPFVAYLTERSSDVSPEDLAELERLVERLRAKGRK
jgi:predicted transcriptional regulator